MKNLLNSEKILSQEVSEPQTIHLTMTLDSRLMKEIKNALHSAWVANDFTYPSVSSFVARALASYHQKKLTLAPTPLTRVSRKEVVSTRLRPELVTLYRSFPRGRRSLLVERILASYLRQIKGS